MGCPVPRKRFIPRTNLYYGGKETALKSPMFPSCQTLLVIGALTSVFDIRCSLFDIKLLGYWRSNFDIQCSIFDIKLLVIGLLGAITSVLDVRCSMFTDEQE